MLIILLNIISKFYRLMVIYFGLTQSYQIKRLLILYGFSTVFTQFYYGGRVKIRLKVLFASEKNDISKTNTITVHCLEVCWKHRRHNLSPTYFYRNQIFYLRPSLRKKITSSVNSFFTQIQLFETKKNLQINFSIKSKQSIS